MKRQTIAVMLALYPGWHMRGAEPMNEARLIVLDPGHFHATLLQKEMYAALAKQVSVYAPLGPDVLDYMQRVTLFNSRKENPTSWQIELHAGPDFLERMLRERPGNVIIISGRNRPKIDRVAASVDAGFNVLVDKPWIIRSSDLPKLEHALNEAEAKGLVAYDIMTERYEITSILQRELVNDAEVFGKLQAGSIAEPAVSARSVHQLMKEVAGVPLRRPAWFFDIAETGEGLADVGTHVVDLVQWTAFPDQTLDYRTDIQVLSGRRWPTVMSQSDFQRVTGEPEFPSYLATHVKEGKLEYFCNNSVDYATRGVHVRMEIVWNWEAPAGTGDSYEATFRGSKSRVEIRQGKAGRFVPELYVVPNSAQSSDVEAGLKKKIEALQARYSGVAAEETAGGFHIVIPKSFRVGHEAHFAQVANQFFAYLKAPKTLPAWEKANMLAKYFVTTKGVEAAH